MDEDEDDLYATQPAAEQPINGANVPAEPSAASDAAMKDEDDEDEDDDDDDEDDEEDEDSDIEIVTEAKPTEKKEPSTQSRRLDIKAEKPSTARSTETPVSGSKAPPSPPSKEAAATKSASAQPQRSGSDYPAIRTSSIDVGVEPILEATGKPLLKTDMDADFGEEDKPWRLPGADQSDFFNYGFDEFTWSSYCLKQENLRKEAKEQEKQLEDMQKFFSVPSAAAPPAATGGGDFPPDMMAMMQQMMASGMDPSNQMDVNNFMQMGGGGAGGGGGGMMGGGGGHYGGGYGGGQGGHGGGPGGRRHGRGRY